VFFSKRPGFAYWVTITGGSILESKFFARINRSLVLPLEESLSDYACAGVFRQGMTDELITTLGK